MSESTPAFRVDTAELSRMSTTAANVAHRLRERELSRNALDGVAASERVSHAYNEFVREWSDGMWKIANNLTELSTRLAAAAEAYDSTEARVSRAAARGVPKGTA